MVESNTLKTSIGKTIKYREMLELVPDHIKTKNMCKDAVKKVPFPIMFGNAILKNGGMLVFVPDWYNDQNTCNKTVDN